MQSAGPYVMEALKAGAMGYIIKDTGAGEIVSAIQAVTQGNPYVSDRVASLVNSDTVRRQDTIPDMYETLTTREREVLQMTAEGKSSSEIGEALMISPRTVEIHRSKVMKKLGLRNQADLIRFAIKRGILPFEE